jgi:peptidoglycan/LPS O-acetylase OafA/YrhL
MRGWLILLSLSLASSEVAQCMQDLAQVATHLMNFTGTDPYSRMAQYSGRKLNDLGDYSNCAKLDYTDYILVQPVPGLMAFFAFCGPKNCTEEDYITILSNLMNSTQATEYLNSDSLKYLEHVVSPYDYANKTIAKKARADLGASSLGTLNVIYPQSVIEDKFGELNAGAIVMLTFCATLVGISITGTVLDIMHQNKLDGYKRQANIPSSSLPMTSSVEDYTRLPDSFLRSVEPMREPSLIVKILMCFSLYTNLKKLFVSRSSEKVGERETLDIFNGVRVMSMGWVVLGHVFLQKVTYTALTNPGDLEDWLTNPKGAMFYGAFFAVDTFFWLSGFLMAYFFIMEYNSKGRMNWPYIYIHRFYRILPAYMFCLFLTWAFTKYLGNGPLWFNGDALNTECKNYWWTNLVFLNNFIPDGDGSGCMGWSWYLANDMQFFLITPIILHIYHKISKALGWLILMGLVLTHMLTNALIANHYEYWVGGLASIGASFQKVYVKPYTRVGPYAVGIMFGLIFFSYKHELKTKRVYDSFALSLSKLLNIRAIRYCSYILGLFLINYLIFIQYPACKDATESTNQKDYWSQDERNAFYALSRVGFATGLGLILLPVLMGHNRVIYEILGNSAWTPLARLSFCGYLIHYGLVFSILVSEPVAVYLSDMGLLYDFMICLIATYVVALPISLMLESPLMAIEKLMKGQPAKVPQPRKQVADKELI